MGEIIKLLQSQITITKGGIRINNFNLTIDSLYNLGTKLIKIAAILIAMYIAIKVGNSIINRSIEKQKKYRFSLEERKSKTVGAILKSILKYSIYFIGFFGIIELFFPNISLTFAGIGGVAVGFGAQSLIKDVINGFFILFEDQFQVGDYITVDDKSGIVESIELRVTKIKDFNGDLHIMPNGLITKVTNHSRSNIRFTVDVDIAYEEDIDNAIKAISEICSDFRKQNKDMVDGPSVSGVCGFKDNAVTIRVNGRAKAMKQWDMEYKLRKEIKNGLSKAKIAIPYIKTQVVREVKDVKGI